MVSVKSSTTISCLDCAILSFHPVVLVRYFTVTDGYSSAAINHADCKSAGSMLCLTGIFVWQVTYSTLIDGCVREGAIDTGKQLLTEMVGLGVKPNAVTYNTLLRAYALDDKVDMKV